MFNMFIIYKGVILHSYLELPEGKPYIKSREIDMC